MEGSFMKLSGILRPLVLPLRWSSPHRRLPKIFTRPVHSTISYSFPDYLSESNIHVTPIKPSITSVVDLCYLSCCLAEESPLKVAVLLSGGVDSSIALRLLHAAGHVCTAYYLKIWFQEDFENFWSECPWDDDLKYAEAVCKQIGVPLEVVHLSNEYWEKVVSHIINEYRSGRTPNPDVLCNTRIKFGAFLDSIDQKNFDYVASGHYANVIHQTSQPSILKLSNDPIKDQTYFLSYLQQSQLQRLLFPLGCVRKEKVRELASKLALPNKDRKDSQGICFLGKVKFSEFVAKQIGEEKGVILEAESGDFLGFHRGFWFYTIGQRQGIGLPGGPWYVVEKDVKNNVLFVSRNYFSEEKKRRQFKVGELRWFDLGISSGSQVRCKVRHGPAFHECKVECNGGELDVRLERDDQGLAAGQYAAFYRGDTCVGCGVILESGDEENGFPVCERARRLAGLDDKSLLGKPVVIKCLNETSLIS